MESYEECEKQCGTMGGDCGQQIHGMWNGAMESYEECGKQCGPMGGMFFYNF